MENITFIQKKYEKLNLLFYYYYSAKGTDFAGKSHYLFSFWSLCEYNEKNKLKLKNIVYLILK